MALIVASCASPAATPAPTEAVVVTEPPAPTQAPPTAAPAQPESTATNPPMAEANKIILATTTSTEDSGLLDYLLPDFQKETGITVDVIAVGTGQALTLGQDGNADVLLVHARAREDKFMAAGHGIRREDVMYNDFVVVGPEADPAGIQGMSNAANAFKKLAEMQATFISRGDDSGTHTKELSIWKKAELEPAGDWYLSAGQGMGEVLTMANEQLGYTLSDRATYLARLKEGLDLVILVEGDAVLFNPYGVIAVDPKNNPNIHNDLPNQFIDWIISIPVQEKIGQFGVTDFGQSLFTPSSKAWMDAQDAAAASAPALKITGKVEQETTWSEDEVKALPTLDVVSKNNQGQEETYTGVSINDLLSLAKPLADATAVVFVADDGFTTEITLAELTACTDCIVSFRSQGGFSTGMPGFSGKLQVKGVIEFQIK
jgi:tungstate transport system substrate-binding protein